MRRSPAALGAPTARWDSPLWQGAETIEITNWEWPVNEGPETKEIHRPQVLARTLYDDKYLAVAFRVQDHYVRAQYTEFQDGVCRDSCCEFFIAPSADSVNTTPFFNFEVNAAATMLLYNCTRVDGHKGNIPLSKEDGATIPMASSLKGTKTAADTGEQIEPEAVGDCTWSIEYHVPWALFAKHHNVEAPPAPGTQWRCNFCTGPGPLLPSWLPACLPVRLPACVSSDA